MVPSVLLPAQFGFPGAMELAVLLLIFMLFAVPVGLVLLGVVLLLRRGGGSNELDDRITELEAQVESLRESVEDGPDRSD